MKTTYALPILLAGAFVLLFAGGCASSKPSDADAAKSTPEEETVQIGYGTQQKGDETGAVTTVDVDKANREQPVTNVSDILKGRVAGVHVSEGPGGGIKVRIRGAQSFSGDDDPLYVIDGLPVTPDPGGVIPFLNPYDIESISVLKDAAATAIYGSDGANGVIVIVTKKQG